MQQPDTKSQWTITPSVFASGVFHVVLVLLLLFGMPRWEMHAEHPEAIQVQLVQPEETAQEEEQPPAPEEPEIAQQPEEEQPPVPEEPELAEQQEDNLQVLDPVFQYGEEDTGPDVSTLSDELDGTEVAEETTPEETQEDQEAEARQAETTSGDPQEDTGAEAQVTETTSEEPQEDAAAEAQVAETTSEEPQEDAEAKAQVEETLQALAAETTSDQPQEGSAAEARVKEALQALAPELVPLPVKKPGFQSTPQRVETTRSPVANGRQAATRDARGLTRGVRAGNLCASELDRRLKYSPYPPHEVPRWVFEEGQNVLQIRKGKYLARNAKWYNVKFRCEVDDRARKVVDFEMEIGREVLW
mgnify:CR=1 FL=1